MTTDDAIAALVGTLRRKHEQLRRLIAKQCPGPHEFVQHRDGRPPWCRACRYTPDGTRIAPDGTA